MRAATTWARRTLSADFVSEGCAFADVDGDGNDELVAGSYWWRLSDGRRTEFREIKMTWLPDWGGGPDRQDPHAHLRRGGGPAQYRAATYDWPVAQSGDATLRLLSVGMHTDPVQIYEPVPGTDHWRGRIVAAGGIYESAIFAELDQRGTRGLVTVPNRPHVAWYEPPADPTGPWLEHLVGEQGGNWHGLGVGPLDADGRPHIITPSGSYASGDDLRRPWRWSHLRHVGDDGRLVAGLGDVCLIHVFAPQGATPILLAASPHGRGIWRWDLDSLDRSARNYRRTLLDRSVTQTHALAVIGARQDEPVDAWVITGKRWQAHGPHHDEDPAGTPVLLRIGIHADPTRPPVVETIDTASGVGLQLAARRLPDGRLQIGVSNKLGVHLFTERLETQ